jgi:hypothetical protein
MALNLPLREDPGAKPVGTAPPTGTRTVFIVDAQFKSTEMIR